MKSEDLQQLAAAYALGALEPFDEARLKAAVAVDAGAKAQVAAFINTAALIGSACPQVQPPPALRAKVLQRISTLAQMPHEEKKTAPAVPPGFHFVFSGESGWVHAPVPGVRLKPLSVSRDMGYHVLLAELEPGAIFPEHDHGGSEDLYIISGHLQTEGRLLGPGDFLHAEPGTHHHELISPDGCVALLIERAPAHA